MIVARNMVAAAAAAVIEVEDNIPLHISLQALPMDEIPCVYLMVSTRITTHCYFGHCTNLKTELRNTNSVFPLISDEVVHGNEFPHREVYRPWLVVGYILGRDSHLTETERFRIRTNLRIRCNQANAESYAAFQMMEDYVREFNATNRVGREIVLVKCCQVRVLDE